MEPRGPQGPPLGSPWGPLGTHGPRGPHGAPNPMLWVQHKFENLPKIYILAFSGSEMGRNKLGFRARDPHDEIRAGILRRIPVSMSQMVGWRPISWQKGVLWGPLGFWAPAHPGRAAGGRANSAPTGVFAIPPFGTWRPGSYAEFWPGSRRGDPGA